MKLFSRRLIVLLLLPVCISSIGCTGSQAVKESKPDTAPAEPKRHGQVRLADSADDISIEFRRWLTRAENSDAQAQFRVGTLYDQGKGVARNPEKASDWFRMAAMQGNRDAQFYLGLMYAKGRGGPKNDTLAAHWFGHAAEQGHAKAQYRLGMAYAAGAGVEHDDKKSCFWLHKAAAQDNISAQHGLGLRYAKGRGVEKDPEKAAEWIYRAGVGFIASGRIEAARVALLDIEQQIPGHTLVTQLRARLTLQDAPPSASSRNVDWAGASVGTGWPIAAGYVITNHHVISGSDKITLINTNGESIEATVVETDPEHDLAVLSVANTHSLPLALPLARQRAYSDASVFTVGFPRIDLQGQLPKVSSGRVSEVTGLKNDASTYQLNLPIQQGNSGGPLMNTNGEVVGIVASMLGAIDAHGNVHPVPSVSFAIKVRHLQDMMSFLPIQDSSLDELPHFTDTIDQLADRIQHSVLIVVAK